MTAHSAVVTRAYRAVLRQVSLKFDVNHMPEDLPPKLAASLGSRSMYPVLVWRSGALMCKYSNRLSESSAEPRPTDVDDVVLVRIDEGVVQVRCITVHWRTVVVFYSHAAAVRNARINR